MLRNLHCFTSIDDAKALIKAINSAHKLPKPGGVTLRYVEEEPILLEDGRWGVAADELTKQFANKSESELVTMQEPK